MVVHVHMPFLRSGFCFTNIIGVVNAESLWRRVSAHKVAGQSLSKQTIGNLTVELSILIIELTKVELNCTSKRGQGCRAPQQTIGNLTVKLNSEAIDTCYRAKVELNCTAKNETKKRIVTEELSKMCF